MHHIRYLWHDIYNMIYHTVLWCVLMLRPIYFPNTYISHFLLFPFSSWGAPMWTELPGRRVQILRAPVGPGDWWDSMWTEWYFPLCGGKVCGRSQIHHFVVYVALSICVLLHCGWGAAHSCQISVKFVKEQINMCFATKAFFFFSIQLYLLFGCCIFYELMVISSAFVFYFCKEERALIIQNRI